MAMDCTGLQYVLRLIALNSSKSCAKKLLLAGFDSSDSESGGGDFLASTCKCLHECERYACVMGVLEVYSAHAATLDKC